VIDTLWSPRIGGYLARRLATLGVAGVVFALPWTALAQSTATSHIDSPISGYWEVHPDSLNAPPASLTRDATAKRMDVYKKEQYARRWCVAYGMPTIMQSFRPVDIQVGERQVVVPSEFIPLPRHIYLRDTHNDPDVLEPSVVGDSIGHFEGDDLLVETTMFSDAGIVTLPGGGFRTSKSQLAERFHPMNDGKNLLITSTWYDPTVFTKPYTYSVYYYRVDRQANQGPYWAGEQICDPQGPNRDQLMQEPKPVPMHAANKAK
jgi:hypothetical protein